MKNSKWFVMETKARNFRGTYVVPEGEFRSGLDEALGRLKVVAPTATARVQKEIGKDGLLEKGWSERTKDMKKPELFFEEYSDSDDPVYEGYASISIKQADQI